MLFKTISKKNLISFLNCPIFLSLVAGALYPLGYPHKIFPSFFLSSTVAIVLLIVNSSIYRVKGNFKHDIIQLLLFSFAYFVIGYYWIPELLAEFGDIFFPFNYLLGSCFSLIIVPQLWALFLTHRIFKKYFIAIHEKFPIKNILIASLFTLFELYVPQQFPGFVGHSFLLIAPYIGLAPKLGPSFFTFISIWFFLEIFTYLFSTNINENINVKSNCICFKRKIPIQLIVVSICVLVFTILNISQKLNYGEKADTSIKVRMVQANIGNNLKINSENGNRFSLSNVLGTFYQLSVKDNNDIDLIIWPETSYPISIYPAEVKKNNYLIPQIFKSISEKTGADLFIGGYGQTASSDPFSDFMTRFNSAFFFTKNANNNELVLKDTYNKHLLLNFGETLPFGPLNKKLSQLITNIAFFAKGDHFPLFETKNKMNFISVICYEILFSNFVREYLNQVSSINHPNFIVNITNDSWYGDTSEPMQHLFLAHWRAIEFDLPLIRMTNTGISSVLYPDGKESLRLNIFETNHLDVEIPIQKSATTTFYQKYGNTPLWLTIIFLNLFIMFTGFINSRCFKRTSVNRDNKIL